MEHSSRENHDGTPEKVGPESETTPVRELRFRRNVVLIGRHFDPEVARILLVVKATAPRTRDNTVWVTRAWVQEEHGLHRTGEAFDIRIKNVVGFNTETFQYCKEVEAWVHRIRKQLGPDYDVVYGDSKHMNHMHIEYDPKKSSVILNAHKLAILVLGE